jgi:hypothetical protein
MNECPNVNRATVLPQSLLTLRLLIDDKYKAKGCICNFRLVPLTSHLTFKNLRRFSRFAFAYR